MKLHIINIGKVAVLSLVLVFSAVENSSGQQRLDKEMREMFDELFKGFPEGARPEGFEEFFDGDEGIRPKNMSPEQFKRFREQMLKELFDGNDPLSRMLELRGAENIGENVRERIKSRYERQSKSHLVSYRPVTKRVAQSIVTVLVDGKSSALGTVVDREGGIVTKASELKDKKTIAVRFSDGSRNRATLVSVDQRNDLALLKVPNTETTPVSWNLQSIENGTTVVTSDQKSDPLAVGVISVQPRSTVGKNLAFLGVSLNPVSQGVAVDTIVPNSAAQVAGLRIGDVITQFDGISPPTVNGVVAQIRTHVPGDVVKINVLRDGAQLNLSAKLKGVNRSDDQTDRLNMMNRMGAIANKRKNNFPSVYQHDTPLLPEQTGGPLVDLDGQAVGINIARGGRVESYAIPANVVLESVRQMKVNRN